MPPVGFEPTISAGERPQTYVLDRAATGTGRHLIYRCKFAVLPFLVRTKCTETSHNIRGFTLTNIYGYHGFMRIAFLIGVFSPRLALFHEQI